MFLNLNKIRHNNNQLKQIPGELLKIQAKDQLPKNCDNSDGKQAQKRKQSSKEHNFL